MRNKSIFNVLAFIMLLVLLGSGLGTSSGISDSSDSSASELIYVPDDYSRIQWAVENATAGDTIVVRDGTYYENVKVNKRLTIMSENGPAYTIVEAKKPDDHVIVVTADHVHISGLTVKDATGLNRMGMFIHANHCTLANNRAENNPYGFFMTEATNNTLINNTASNNLGDGIYVNFSSGNTISNNTVVNSKYRNGIRL